MAEPVKPRTISTPRWQAGLGLGICLLPVTVALTLSDCSDPEAWQLELGAIFFGLCAAVFAWVLVSPGRVLFHAEGFTVTGGFGLIPWTIRWRDVDAFVPLEYSGVRIVGFRYARGYRPPSRRRFTRWRGADEMLPSYWRSPTRVADELNEYRTRALTTGAMDTNVA
jgi:hypothetical protein